MTKQIRTTRLLCALALIGLAGTASANLTKPVYSQAKDEVKAMFKAERDKCGSLSGKRSGRRASTPACRTATPISVRPSSSTSSATRRSSFAAGGPMASSPVKATASGSPAT